MIRKEIRENELDDIIDNKFPANVFLQLKVGAQVKMINNDSAKRWTNGPTGVVTQSGDEGVTVMVEGNRYALQSENGKKLLTGKTSKQNRLKKPNKEVSRNIPLSSPGR